MNAITGWLKGWKLLFVGYAILLIFSHLWELFNDTQIKPSAQQDTVTVNAVLEDSLLDNQDVNIAYLDEYRGTIENPPVLLLLHGSPVGTPMFEDIIASLSDSLRVVAPDLPGYHASTRDIPDYSVEAYSFYINQLLNKLDISETHVAGYSLGGAVAIHLAHQYKPKVKSVALISSLGVQELELLGSYHLNHAVHGLQLMLVWSLHNLIPHFGLLNNFPINIPYARSFYDTDQRPIRDYLSDYKKPMLIQHGIDDDFVPLVAAKEHHRIVPQSELKLYEGGHGIVISKAEPIAEDLTGFIYNVERSQAKTYAEASLSRLEEAQQPFTNVSFTKFKGLTLAVILVLIVFSTFISEDLTCIGAGLMAARGLLGFWPATLACLAGIFIGDMGLYVIGRWLGRPALRKAPLKWIISKEDLEKSEKWFQRRGPAIIIASRFLPGSRFPTYFSAGVIKAGFWMFSFYFLVAAILWTPLLVGIAMIIGNELLLYFSLYKNYAIWVFLGVILLLIVLAKVIIPAFSYRGRRFLVSKFCRITNWEFWPPYIIYLPVIFYIIYLSFKFRSLTVFTAANPSIPDGGFINESKSEILDLFKSIGKVGAHLFIDHAIELDKKIKRAEHFLSEHNLTFPVFVKPDRGQRGSGVTRIENKKSLIRKFKETGYDLILQENIEGEEFGIFYYRYPDEKKGQIFSVTVKHMYHIEGDGKRTLEELILDDERAVCLAKVHIKEHSSYLYEVPGKGEKVELVKYGTHARGAIFEDGSTLITEELTKEIDRICSEAEGFFFGRLDIKTDSKDTLKRGENLKIIEINGVTSESTNIYDSKFSFWDAQRILCKQWRIAFELGEVNRKKGFRYSSPMTLIKKILHYRAKN